MREILDGTSICSSAWKTFPDVTVLPIGLGSKQQAGILSDPKRCLRGNEHSQVALHA